MKTPNYFRNILLAFLLFFVGQFLVSQLGNWGVGVILVGVVIFYAVWWRAYQRNKTN